MCRSLFFASLLAISVARNVPETSPDNHLHREMSLLGEAAFEFVRNLTCQDVFFTTEEDCRKLTSLPRSQMNLYSAVSNPGEKVEAVLPDGPLTRGRAHDALLVLDPYPRANLGHLLLVFFVDVGWSRLQCEINGGHFTDENVCVTLALRKRCHNLLLESKWKLKFLNKQYKNKQCEINFFPLVHIAGETPSHQAQKLRCRDDIEGFAPCPVLRPINRTDSFLCDPLQTNTQSCSVSEDKEQAIGTRCRLFERCDHAVVLSGGWNNLADRPLYLGNALAARRMLRDNGFPEGNIKTFYSNGRIEVNDADENLEVYPSTLKLPMRYHLRKVCQSLHCADSLVVYLSGPAASDGSILLWDADGNGQADENEQYSVKELLFDLRDCAAQQVFVIADHSHSGVLVHALRGSQRHPNVMAFSSGEEQEYSWDGEFTRRWSALLRSEGSNDACVGKSFEVIQQNMTSSRPMLFQGTDSAPNATLFGAPCGVRPPFTERELNRKYFGCQNLPTAIWLRRRRTFGEDEESEESE